ncbi:hypothetical protein [Luoshenia tenuis]|nr:hypothetical protein [Luoshenia tenuis]
MKEHAEIRRGDEVLKRARTAEKTVKPLPGRGEGGKRAAGKFG